MKKISIIWISGTGKSWFARKLSQKLWIPVYHYDTLCWKENWQEEKESVVWEKIKDILSKDTWILEGFISPLAHERLKASDIILYLDFSWWRAVLWGLQRYWYHKNTPRPELPSWCQETLDFWFFKTIFLRKERAEIEREVIGFESKIVRFYSRNEMKKYIATLP